MDLLIQGGRVIDPSQGIDAMLDLLVVDGAVKAKVPATLATPPLSVESLRD